MERRRSLPPFPADRPSPSLSSSNIGPTCRVRRRGGEWVFKSSPQKKLPEGSKNKAIRKVPQPARTMRRTACPKEQFSPRYGWNFVGPPSLGESGRGEGGRMSWHHHKLDGRRTVWERGKGGREREEDEGERPIENIFYGQPTAASSSRRNCDGLGAAAQNEPRSILPLMNGLEDGARSPWPP